MCVSNVCSAFLFLASPSLKVFRKISVVVRMRYPTYCCLNCPNTFATERKTEKRTERGTTIGAILGRRLGLPPASLQLRIITTCGAFGLHNTRCWPVTMLLLAVRLAVRSAHTCTTVTAHLVIDPVCCNRLIQASYHTHPPGLETVHSCTNSLKVTPNHCFGNGNQKCLVHRQGCDF